MNAHHESFMIGFELAFLIGLFALMILLIFLRRRRYNPTYLFFLAVFWIYLLFVFKKTLFPIPISINQHPSSFDWRINMTPLFFGEYANARSIFLNAGLNTLLTVPFGFGIPFITRLRARDFLWLPLAVGFGIEMLQLLFSLLIRNPYRVLDINDVIFNALGVLTGYAFFRVFARAYQAFVRWVGVTRTGVLAYVYQVTARSQNDGTGNRYRML